MTKFVWLLEYTGPGGILYYHGKDGNDTSNPNEALAFETKEQALDLLRYHALQDAYDVKEHGFFDDKA